VDDTVAGLYQINVQLPSTFLLSSPLQPNFPSTVGQFTTLLAPAQLPVFVTAGGVTSQAGVMLSVAPMLQMTAPAGTAGLTVGQAYTGTVIAALGTSPYLFAVTSGVLPAGLTLNATTGVIAGNPAQYTGGNYSVTVTATDSAATPVTGGAKFVITVAGGLYLTSTANTTSTHPTPNAAVTTVTAIGGTAPYSYAITATSLPTGMAIDPVSGIISTTSATPAGTTTVTVTATDSANPAVTGTLIFDIVIG
jgi:hypothetical protein